MGKTVYALILNYNSAIDCIELFKQLKDLEINILILDNNSDQKDIQLLKKSIPEKFILENGENKGYAAGNNRGIKIALENNADYIWLLNPDIRLEKDTLSLLLRTINKNTELAAVGPRIVGRENPDIIYSDGGTIAYDERCHADHLNYGENVSNHPPTVNFDPDYVDGSCILIRANALKRLGLLPEFYFLYFEETHWCVNATKSGWSLAVNHHAIAYNKKSLPSKNYIYYTFRNRLLFAKKFHPEPSKVYGYYGKLLFKQIFERIFHINHPPLLKLRIKAFLNAKFFKSENFNSRKAKH